MGVRDVARLDRELEATLGARPRDPAACADVLARAAFACRTDPIAAQRWVEAELLDELVDCYETLGRYDEAITVMRRALQVGWSGEPDGRCRIAELLMRDGRVDQATEIWEQVKVDTPDDVWLYNNAGLEYADIDDHHTALQWLTQGLQLAMATGDPEDLVDQLADLRADSLAELGLPDDELQQQAASFVPSPGPRPHRPIRDPHGRHPRIAATRHRHCSRSRCPSGWGARGTPRNRTRRCGPQPDRRRPPPRPRRRSRWRWPGSPRRTTRRRWPGGRN